jgi:hypothetical protein
MGKTVTVAGRDYTVGRLSAMQQFHVVRRLAAVLAGVDNAQELHATLRAGAEGLDLLPALARGVAALDDAQAEFVVLTCLGVVQRQQAGGGWAGVVAGGRLMFEDMDLPAMLTLVGHVLAENLGGFFAALPGVSPGAGQTCPPSGSQ